MKREHPQTPISSSSDDDDDRGTLLNQHERNPHHEHNNNDINGQQQSTSSSTFDITHPESPTLTIRHHLFAVLNLKTLLNKTKRYSYVFVILLPLFLVILSLSLFSVDFGNLFSSSFSWTSSSSSVSSGGGVVFDSLRESQLEALYLLSEQQRSLVSLFNRFDSTRNSSVLTNNNTDHIDGNVRKWKDGEEEGFKSEVFEQISLNKQIQKVLLSSHVVGDDVDLSSLLEDNATSASGVSEFVGCRKVDWRRSDRRMVDWNPRSDKFLFPICLSGQMSNHLICLEKHMFFAALLDRVLVIPSHKFDYQYSKVLDIEHINKCLGKHVVVTYEEFAQKRKNHVHIDRFICYFSSPTPCYVDEDHVKKLKGLGVSMGKLESPWKEDIKKPSRRTVEDVKSKFASNDNVIAIGDVFFADVEGDWLTQPGGPITHSCKTLIEPSRLIILTAQRFIQTFLGNNFIALHFRRHGFLKFCNAKKPSCFYPIPQAANCIARMAARANAPVIYLSTDAADSETNLLLSLITVNGKTVPLVKRPPPNSAEKWDALLYRHHIEGDSRVEAMLDKTICGMSNVFIGAPGSTFTEDILRLRKGWGTSSLCDEYLCQGELPNFIAEDE